MKRRPGCFEAYWPETQERYRKNLKKKKGERSERVLGPKGPFFFFSVCPGEGHYRRSKNLAEITIANSIQPSGFQETIHT
tara:strand:- start:444 stop:683 length:240 start_codon:yes stop_codon:yes gene_type:complete